MKNLSWIAALLGVLLLVVYGIALSFLGGEAKLGMDAASEVAVGVPTWAHALGGVGGLLTLAGLAGSWSALRAAGEDQTTGRVATASFAVALVLAVSVVLNVIAQRYDDRWDLTATKRYTLSQQSLDIVRALDREVQVIAFFPTGSPDATNFQTLLEDYTRETTLLKAEFHDPYGDPVLAEQFKITSAGATVILKSGDTEQRLEYDTSEQAFTNALVKVTSGKTHTLCGVTGHGESEGTDDQTANGLGVAVNKLQGQNYTWRSVKLLEAPPTPESCEVVILAGPQQDLAVIERDRLAQYVAGGGHLIAMLEPMVAPETAADFARYGVTVRNDIVIDVDPNRQVPGGGPTFVVLDGGSTDAHPVTAKLQTGIMVMREARSVAKAADAPAGVEVAPMLHASASSWGETDIAQGEIRAQPTDGADAVGNVGVAVAVEVKDPAGLRTTTQVAAAGADVPSVTVEGTGAVAAPVAPSIAPKAGGKVAVFGDADFAMNQGVLNGTNQDLLLNTVAWMVGEDAQISIRTNEAGSGKLTLDLFGLFVAGITSLVIVPGLTIAGAIGTWMVRRRL